MLVIYCDQGNYMIDINSKPNDIFENCNTIVTVGMNLIEVFEFSNNNLFKKDSITLNLNHNNITPNNNDNSNSDNQILCIEFAAKSFLVCGHDSGLISVWQPRGEKPFMKQIQAQKMHDASINKILYFELQKEKNYLLTCSSDMTVKRYDMILDKCEKEKQFENEVMNIKKVEESYSQEINIYFIVSLKDGKLFVLNTEIEVLFEIPSRFKTNLVRQVLSLNNMEKTDKKGSYLLITENNKIEIYTWIKEGSFEFHLPKRGNDNIHQNPNHGQFQQQFQGYY